MFLSWGLHETVVTFLVVCACALQGKPCFSPHSSFSRNRNPTLCCRQWGVRSRGMDVCAGKSPGWHPTAQLCACSSSQHHRRWAAFLSRQSPQPYSWFLRGNYSWQKPRVSAQKKISNNPDFSLPSLSPEPPQPGTRREHSGTPNMGLAQVPCVVWRPW